MRAFCDLVRDKRIELGYSQRALSEICKTSRFTISRIEQNETDPGLNLVINLAECLDIDLNELKKGE